MKIKSLEQMEEIVSSNKSLIWDGWNVVHLSLSDKARTSKFGVYLNGKWFMKKTFVVDKNGWDIPDRLVRQHAKV